MTRFTTTPLGDVAKLLSGGTPSKGNADYWDGDIPWLTPRDMGQWAGETSQYVTSRAIGNGTRLAPHGSVFIAVRGMSLHTEIRIVRSTQQLSFNQDIKAIVASDGFDQKFLYYALLSKRDLLLSWVSAAGHGTGVLDTDRLMAVPIPQLHLAQQRSIADMLADLDDKIELNRRMNETLEALTGAIFKDWFVDFGPTRAKMEGRVPYLAPETWKLFPDRLDGEGKPEGWQSARLGELCSRIAIGPFGSNITTDNFVADGVPVIRGGNLKSGFIDDNFVFVSEKKADDLSNANVVRGDVVLTHRGTLGQVGIVPENSRFSRYVISQSQMFLRTDAKRTSPRFIYEFLRSPDGKRQLLANTGQTGVPAISRPTTSLKMLELNLPPLCTIKNFEEVASSLSAKVEANVAEIGSLLAIRDLLLPKLMSGELRIRDAEVMVAVAA